MDGELPAPDGTFECRDARCPATLPPEGGPCEPLATACEIGSERVTCVDGAWRIEAQPLPM